MPETQINQTALGGAGSTAPATAPASPVGPTGAAPAPTSWRDTLPDELKSEASLASFTDVANLAKSYVNAQKELGKHSNKIAIPDKHATDDDWRGLMEKLGLPKELKDYNVAAPKDSGLNEDFIKQFAENAHKAGVLPKQTQKLLDWYTNAFKDVVMNNEKTAETQRQEALNGLRKEWGDAWDNNVLAASLALKDFGDEETAKFFETSRLGDNPTLLKFLSKIGRSLKEEDLKGEISRRGGNSNTLTPDAANKSIGEIMGNSQHPYNDTKHPNHKAAVEDMAKLFAQAHPEPGAKK